MSLLAASSIMSLNIGERMKSDEELIFPTRMMKLAVNLREQHGLDDAEIGKRLKVSREWACKLRGEYKRRMERIQLQCADAGGDASIIQRLISKN